MNIKKIREELGNENFYKICILFGLVALTIIIYFIKQSSLNVNWEILGFIGVIITIITTEWSRNKQNRYNYKKEKIINEQIEFKHMIKEKIDFLELSQIIDTLTFINVNNYREVNLRISEYKKNMRKIYNDIVWFYSKGECEENTEIFGFLQEINMIIAKYNEELYKFFDIFSNFVTIEYLQLYANMEALGNIDMIKKKEIEEYRKKNKTINELYEEINKKQFEILEEIIKYRDEKIILLYQRAHKVVEERDTLMNVKLEN